MRPWQSKAPTTVTLGAATVALGTLLLATAASAQAQPSAARSRATSQVVIKVSASCAYTSSEVEQAVDPKLRYVYEDWIGCGSKKLVGTIAFVRSTNGGTSFSTPYLFHAPANGQVWDPAVTVGPDGTLYVSYMASDCCQSFPVVAVSRDHGQKFTTVTQLRPPNKANWGDRDFITAGAGGLAYLTWDYGPRASQVRVLCPPAGSCSFSNGDLNIVIQKSTDYGKHWGKMIHISPGYPAGGADLGPLVLGPKGQVDVLYQALAVTNKQTDALGPGHIYFGSSNDGGATWTRPQKLGPGTGSVSINTWWIDGALSIDSGGNLYASWDTQGSKNVGWLVYSTDGGTHWSAPVKVLTDPKSAVLILEAAGGKAGEADAGWLSDAGSHGYQLFVRPYSIKKGWLSSTRLASASTYGKRSVWPGDTFGISYLNNTGRPADGQQVTLVWGSALSSIRDDMFATTVDLAS